MGCWNLKSSRDKCVLSDAFLPGDKPAVLHLEDPELFAAQLKILKDLVSKQDAPRDVQNVQVVAFC